MTKTIRADSWAAKLTPDQQMELYRKAKQFGVWTQTVQWAVTEYKLSKVPKQTAFYQWMRGMREEEQRQRIENAAITATEADALGKKAPRDETIIAALKARILEAALAGNAREAAELTRIADILHRHLVEEKKLALAERHLQLIEQEKAGEVKKLRGELTAAQEEAKQNKKTPLVAIYKDGVPLLRRHHNGSEDTVTGQTEQPTSDPAASTPVPPPETPPGDPN